VRDGDGWVINGSKTFITNGHRAGTILLVTKTDAGAGYEGFTLFLVPMDAPGVIRERRLEKMGMHASDTALLAFQDVRVGADAVLGHVGKGFFHIMWELRVQLDRPQHPQVCQAGLLSSCGASPAAGRARIEFMHT
jgi:alkylation response protein AidB-like acyl-CoA dehydrogenase